MGEKKHELLELLDVGVITYSAAGVLTYANAAASTLLELSAEELVSSSPERRWDILDSDGQPVSAHEEPFEEVLRTREPIRGRLLGVLTAGASLRRWLRVDAIPLRDDAGAVAQVLVSFTDVSTERRRVEEAQAARSASEQRHSSVLRAMSEGVAVHDTNGAIAFSNPSAERILGLTRDQLRGVEGVDPRWALVTPEGAKVQPEQVPSEITRATGQACKGVVLGVHRANGERAWLSISTDPIAGDGNASRGVVATFSDITAQREAQIALERANARLTAVTSSMPGVIYQILVRHDGTASFPFAAGQTLELTGLTAEEIAAAPDKVEAILHPDDVERARAATLEATTTFSLLEMQVRFRSGTEWRWGRARATPARTAEGTLFTGVIIDVTEEHVLAERLERAQRREILGDLAAGVAHNFNNMLAAVLPNLEAVRMEAETSPSTQLALDDAIDATQRASDLVRQLMYVARGGGDDDGAEPVDLNLVVGDVVKLCRRSFDPGIVIRYDVSLAAPARTFGRPIQVHQVVLNLCLNARDAMLGRAPSCLRVSLADQPGPVPGRTDGESHVVITIADTGSGMDEATLRRIGEPFFTTKPPGRGTGLGIASALATVRDMAGHLEVVSRPGIGTTFEIHLPRSVDVVATSALASAPPASRGTRTTTVDRVLLVDDERLVRRAVERMLATMCRETVTAEDGDHALDVLDAREGRFDLVLLDLSMPGASGREVLRTINARWPSLPVIIMSGDTGHREHLEGAAEILEKPLDAGLLDAALLRAVRRA